MLNCLRDGCGLQAGDHICWVYESDEEHRDVLTRFLKEGLARHERVLYLARRFTASKVMGYLQDAGVAAEEYLRSGQLVFLDAEAAYLGEDGFQPERMGDAFRQAATQAVVDGYRGLRAASETEWLIPEFVSPAAFVELGEDCAGRVPRPHANPFSTAPGFGAGGVRGALQHGQTTPLAGSGRFRTAAAGAASRERSGRGVRRALRWSHPRIGSSRRMTH